MDRYEGYDDGLDPDGPSADDLERFGRETRTCPACSYEVYDQAELCSHCGHAFEQRDEGGLPRWAVITAVLVLAAFLLVFVF